jgi:hypothetical protein
MLLKNKANQHGNKIDEVVVAKACSGEAHSFLDGFQVPRMNENLSPRPPLLPAKLEVRERMWW